MPFDLVPEGVLRALRYLDLLNRNGEYPTPTQVDNFAASSGPFGVEYTSPMFTNYFATIASVLPTKVRDAEPVSQYLSRMEWATGAEVADVSNGFVARPEEGMKMTRLGVAFLAGARQEQAEQTDQEAVPRTVTLEPQDPLSQVELAQMTSNAGAGMLFDPYLKPEALHWLITSTEITRALIKTPDRGVGAYRVTLGYTLGSERVDLRATSSVEFHDRAIVGADGAVTIMGTSVNGVGRHLSSLTTLTPADGASLRARYESLFDAADRVEAVRMDGTVETAAADGAAAS